MGYYTDYKVNVYKQDKNVTAYDMLSKMNELQTTNRGIFYPFDGLIQELMEENWTKQAHDFELETDDECKWYEWADDMKDLSKAFPNVIFQVSGEGEEQGDIWRAWIKNGKVVIHEARIVIDPLDEKE